MVLLLVCALCACAPDQEDNVKAGAACLPLPPAAAAPRSSYLIPIQTAISSLIFSFTPTAASVSVHDRTSVYAASPRRVGEAVRSSAFYLFIFLSALCSSNFVPSRRVIIAFISPSLFPAMFVCVCADAIFAL